MIWPIAQSCQWLFGSDRVSDNTVKPLFRSYQDSLWGLCERDNTAAWTRSRGALISPSYCNAITRSMQPVLPFVLGFRQAWPFIYECCLSKRKYRIETTMHNYPEIRRYAKHKTYIAWVFGHNAHDFCLRRLFEIMRQGAMLKKLISMTSKEAGMGKRECVFWIDKYFPTHRGFSIISR